MTTNDDDRPQLSNGRCGFMRRKSATTYARLSTVLLLLWPTNQTIAGTIRHDRPDSSYTSLAISYPSVGALTWSSYICSATLIDDNWILTAGHCLDEVGLSASDWTFDLTGSGGGVHMGAERFVHPDWTTSGGDLNVGADIALLKLSTMETAVTPAELNANTSEVGRTATHVGFGRSGTGVTGMITNAGTKRAGNNTIDVDGSLVAGFNDKVLFEDFDSPAGTDNWSGSATPLELEYLIASGDSGGPMFVDFGNGDVVAGVHSFISSVDSLTDADYGDISGSTRVSSYLSWIYATMEANGDAVAPELASWTIWVVFGSGLLFYRFRAVENL